MDVCRRGAVVAERALAHEQVSGFDPRLHGGGAPDSDEGRDADSGDLLDGDRRRRAAMPVEVAVVSFPLYMPVIVRAP